jgi:ABC-type multidrug transport system ATPase subunit
MIDVARLTKTYGDFTAVKDFSFHVAAGEIVGLIGPNGAGKTSTLRSIAGIHAPTGGAITIDGHNIVANPVEAKQQQSSSSPSLPTSRSCSNTSL